MILAELIFALVIAVFFTLIFAVLGLRPRSWTRLLAFFFVVFLAAWAGGIWITPVGGSLLGVYWVGFFVVGLIIALVLEAVAAFSPRSPRARELETEKKEEESIEPAIGVFFWILFFAFVLVIILGYVHRAR
jgi:hypothetical protein